MPRRAQQFQRLEVRLALLAGLHGAAAGLFQIARCLDHPATEKLGFLNKFGRSCAQRQEFGEGGQVPCAGQGVLQGQPFQAQLPVTAGSGGGQMQAAGTVLQFSFKQAHLSQLGLGGPQRGLGVVAGRHAARQAGGLLHVGQQRRPLGLDHAHHLTLTDHRQPAASQTGPAQRSLHVAGTHAAAHQVLLGRSVAVDSPGEVQPFTGRGAEFHLYLGQPEGGLAGRITRRTGSPFSTRLTRPALAGAAVKDQLGGPRRPQLPGPRLMADPAQRLDHVRFPRTVRADHHRDPGAEFQPGAAGERFEALQRQT